MMRLHYECECVTLLVFVQCYSTARRNFFPPVRGFSLLIVSVLGSYAPGWVNTPYNLLSVRWVCITLPMRMCLCFFFFFFFCNATGRRRFFCSPVWRVLSTSRPQVYTVLHVVESRIRPNIYIFLFLVQLGVYQTFSTVILFLLTQCLPLLPVAGSSWEYFFKLRSNSNPFVFGSFVSSSLFPWDGSTRTAQLFTSGCPFTSAKMVMAENAASFDPVETKENCTLTVGRFLWIDAQQLRFCWRLGRLLCFRVEKLYDTLRKWTQSGRK